MIVIMNTMSLDTLINNKKKECRKGGGLHFPSVSTFSSLGEGEN